MPFLDARINPSPVDPRHALTVAVDESGRTEAMSDIPDIQHQAYKYGVIGESVKAAGKLTQELHLGYKKGMLGNELQDIYSPIQESQLQIAQIENDLNDLNRRKRMLTDTESIRYIEPEYIRKTEELIKAKEQGAIASKDVELRQAKALREAVNRNPGYASALIEHARDTLYAAGIRKITDPYIAIEKAKRQAEKDEIELFTAQAKSVKLILDPEKVTSKEYRRQMLPEIQKRSDEDALYQQLERNGKLDDHLKKSNRFEREEQAAGITAASIRRLDGAVDEYLTLRNNTTDKNELIQLDLNFTSTIEEALTDRHNALVKSGYTYEEASNMTKNLRTLYKQKKDIIEKYNSKKISKEEFDAVKEWDNALSASMAKIGYDESFIKMALSDKTKATMIKNNPSLAPLIEDFHQLQAALYTPEVKKLLLNKMQQLGNKSAAVHFLDTFIADGNPKAVAETMRLYNDTITKDITTLSKKDKIQFRDNYIYSLSKLPKEASEFLDNNVKENTKQILEDQLNLVVSYVRESNVNWDNTITVTPTGEVSLTVYEKGTDRVNTKHTQEARYSIADRINDIVKANAAINGITKSESASQVLRNYAPELGISLPQQEQTTKPKEQDMLTKEYIKSKEGFRSKAYQDQGGKWTIGYGFTSIDGVPVKEGDTITEEEAEFQMDKILENHQSFKSKITIPLTPYQIDALSSFEFNLGGNVWNQPRGKQMIEAINRGDFNTAAELWRTYTKVKNRKTGQYEQSEGLVNRRNEETALFTKPVQVASGD